MLGNNTFSFFVQLQSMVENLQHQRLAEVSRMISFSPSESYKRHRHFRIEINYIEKGDCLFDVQGEKYHFGEGELVAIASNVEHSFEAGRNGTVLLQLEFLPEICSMFGGAVNMGLERLSDFGMVPFVRISHDAHLGRIIQQIIWELNVKNPHYQEMVAMYYAELLMLIQRYVDNETHLNVPNKFVKQAIQYMRCHLTENVKMAGIADYLQITERYLSKLFVRYLQCSPMEYMVHLRIEKSINLIKNTDKSIKEICFLCGFNAPQTFSRAFKAHVGMCPKEFKQFRVLQY